MASLASILETFLVEWKQAVHHRLEGREELLETFLVEWKHNIYLRVEQDFFCLETFLVEWKLVPYIVPLITRAALKPS